MAEPKALLDTDILSAVMRGCPAVIAQARTYLAEHPALAFSIITRYEILRGLKAKNATTQLHAFDRFCETCLILPLTDEIVVRAADIYLIPTAKWASDVRQYAMANQDVKRAA